MVKKCNALLQAMVSFRPILKEDPSGLSHVVPAKAGTQDYECYSRDCAAKRA